MRARRLRAGLAVTAVVVVGIGVVWVLMGPLAAMVAGPDLRALTPADRLAALNTIRSRILTLAGVGVVVLAASSLFTAWRARDNDARIERQFDGALRHVASHDPLVRAGGFYALGMIWRDWPREHQHVLDTVLGWLRDATSTSATSEHAAGCPAMDVAAAAAEMLRRPVRTEREPLDLSGADLSYVDLSGANLNHAILRHARLTGATLTEANLTGADLRDADLTDTIGLSTHQLAVAITNTTTQLPQGITRSAGATTP
ncbi:MAG: pentapeptide repeat-containing protein [Pseudonocardiaceae bacterium]